jgi:tetratricopeptide (TPR) repeat protein
MSLDVALKTARRGHASVVILGSVSRLGDVIRIDVQIHDANGTLVSAESLTAPVTRLLSDVDVLAIRVSSDLGVRPDDRRQVGVAAVMTDNIEAYRAYSLAVEKANAFDTAGALSLLEHAVALDPRFAMAHARIGYTYTAVRVNEDARALPYFEKAFALSDRLSEKDRLFIDAWYSLARNEDEEYVTKLQRIIDRFPLETEAYWRLGMQLAYLKRPEESVAVCERGLAMDPDAKEIWNPIGHRYNLLGKYDRAIAAHERCVALDPREPNAHDSLGITYGQAGRFDDALATLDRALALRPGFHFAVVHKGDVLFMLGRYREALQQYQRYIEVAPSDWDRAMGYNHLALVHWRRGDVTRAEAAARQEHVFKNDFGTSLQLAAPRPTWCPLT